MNMKRFCLLAAVLPVLAARPALGVDLPPETPEAIRSGLETIDKYRAEVEKRTGNAPLAPLTVAPPRTSITPDAPARDASALPERDPFEVSPRLREGGGRDARLGLALNQALRLRAVVRTPEGGIAKIESGKDSLVVRDGDELDVNGIRYTVKVEADGLVLRGAGAPQYKMQIR